MCSGPAGLASLTVVLTEQTIKAASLTAIQPDRAVVAREVDEEVGAVIARVSGHCHENSSLIATLRLRAELAGLVNSRNDPCVVICACEHVFIFSVRLCMP